MLKSTLNVVIDRKGVVYDAVPSHQTAIERHENIDISKLARSFNKDEMKYFQFSLARATSSLMVWSQECCGKPNASQVKALRALKMSGKYNGAVPFVNEECNIYLRGTI